jgi:hypothetical protein
MFYGSVEGDNGEVISIGGYGKTLLSYLTPLNVYCFINQESDPMYRELAHLVSEAGDILCPLSGLFFDKMTSGEWPYGEDEYQRYLTETHDISLTEDQFRSSILHHNQAWAAIPVLKSAVLDVLAVHQRIELPETWWYHPVTTREAFQAVFDALAEIEKHGAQRARLNIE